jgi:hypothetical protein
VRRFTDPHATAQERRAAPAELRSLGTTCGIDNLRRDVKGRWVLAAVHNQLLSRQVVCETGWRRLQLSSDPFRSARKNPVQEAEDAATR